MRSDRDCRVQEVTATATTFTSDHRGGDGPPLVLLHGFLDTWRSWELVLPALERRCAVFAPTLPGHAGGPPIDGDNSPTALLDMLERMLDAAGITTAHIAGNSLGGFAALQLAARGRALSVTALAPAGGWSADDPGRIDAVTDLLRIHEQAQIAAPFADAVAATPDGRRQLTSQITVAYEHIPAELLAHQLVGVARCTGANVLSDGVAEHGWPDLHADRIDCPVRVVWGTEDRVLHWPTAAVRYREEWLPDADWVELDGVGHCPQLDVPDVTAALIGDWATA